MLLRILIFALLTYIVVKIIQIFTRVLKGSGQRQKFTNPTPTESKVNKDDIIDADFEDISSNENQNSK